jgi:hypothetical protein
MDPSAVWVTRMRAILPSNALTQGDMVVQASATQTPVSNQHTALVYDDPAYDGCSAASGGSSNAGGGGGGGCSTVRDTPYDWSQWLVAGTLGFAALSLLRRRLRGGDS